MSRNRNNRQFRSRHRRLRISTIDGLERQCSNLRTELHIPEQDIEEQIEDDLTALYALGGFAYVVLSSTIARIVM